MRLPAGIRPRWLVLTYCLCTTAYTFGASIEDVFEYDWYEVEFFVFERTEVMEHTSDERLVLDAPRQLPQSMVAPLPGPEGFEAYYRIDAQSRLCLDYPTAQIDSQKLFEKNPGSPAAPSEAPSATPASEPSETSAASAPDMSPGSPETAATDPLQAAASEVPPTPRDLLLADIARFEQTLLGSALQWLPAESLQLRNEARRIESSGTGRLLFHGRWRMPVPPRTAPNPMLLSAGVSLAPLFESQELLGIVGVTLGRYLHFQAELFFSSPVSGGRPVSVFDDGAGYRRELPAIEAEGGYMKLSESRRMRSAELHYLDHPKLGLVVRIDPVVIPSPLLEAFNSLEEPL